MQSEKMFKPSVVSEEMSQENLATEIENPEDSLDEIVDSKAAITDAINTHIDRLRHREQDQIDLTRNIGFLAVVSLFTTSASISGIAHGNSFFTASLLGASGGYFYGSFVQYARQRKLTSVQRDNYTFQPLRASGDSELAAKGDILVVVHPPQNEAGKLYCNDLDETLEILAEVNADTYFLRHAVDDPIFAHKPSTPYHKAINDIKQADMHKQEDEVVTSFSRQELIDFLETRKPAPAELQKALRDQLGTRFPSVSPLLEDIDTHHDAIRATLASALAGRLSEPRQVSEVDSEHLVRIKDKRYFTASINAVDNTYTIRNDAYAPDAHGALSSLVDTNDTAMLLKKLKGGSLSEIELLALGLTSSLRPISPEDEPTPNDKEVTIPTVAADLRRNLRAMFTRDSLGALRYPLTGAVSIAALALVLGDMPKAGPTESIAPEKNSVGVGKAMTSDQPALHVRSHGLHIDGYYAQQGFSHLNGKTLEWEETAQHAYDTLWYPTSYTLANPSIEVERQVVADEENRISLAVKTGTTLASVQLTDAAGKPVPFDTLRRDDGFFSLRLRTTTDAPLLATYSLVEDTTGSYFISPLHPLEVSGPQPLHSDFAKNTSITQKQRYLQQDLTYDNTENLEQQMEGTDASTLRQATLQYGERLANCNVAATILALDEVASGNKKPLALVTGFNVADTENLGDQFATTPHAWLANDEMPVIDPTPVIAEGKTETEVGLAQSSQGGLQKKWQDDIKNMQKKAAYLDSQERLGGAARTAAALSLAALAIFAGRRRKQISRSVTRAADTVRVKTFPPRITTNTLSGLLAYEAYSSHDDTTPATPELAAGIHWKALENTEAFSSFTVSDEALQSVAEGKSPIVQAVLPKSEQRQAQQRAKMMLRQREILNKK